MARHRAVSRTDVKKAQKANKAGRNMGTAVAVGVTLSAIFLLSLLHPVALSVLVMAAGGVGLYELAAAFARKGIQLALPPLWVGLAGMLVCANTLGIEGLFGAFCLTVMAALVWRLLDEPKGQRAARDIAASAFAATYVGFLGSFAVLMYVKAASPYPLVLTILLSICNDTGGLLVGMNFGKHPLAPHISPKKSWEGFLGSILSTTVAGVLGIYLMGGNVIWGAVFGALAAVIATCGDLGESLLKRNLELKDMSDILPGHGGVMDRLDSILVLLPFAYSFYYLALGW